MLRSLLARVCAVAIVPSSNWATYAALSSGVQLTLEEKELLLSAIVVDTVNLDASKGEIRYTRYHVVMATLSHKQVAACRWTRR